ncbi:MAG: Uma2 family endonuclease [Clostridiales Family XIII bacterium]|jgi:Uma2 family endonuclease|nr:Uma2 family endonuclease [Clostridiales Family XIII bacterium]
MEAALKNEYFTYADYAGWDTDERYELIDGVPYLMSPAPSVRHQEIVGELYAIFRNFLAGKPCRTFVSPIDVRLNADAEDDTVVQPDVIVVCDKSKIGDKSINGAPDLVVEILSPSSEQYDSGAKLDKYLESGVRECWVVNPEANTVRVYAIESKGGETGRVYREPDAIKTDILPGLTIPLAEIFANS